MLALLLVVKVGSLSPVSSLTTQPEPPGQFSALQISASNTKSTSRRAIASGSLSPFSFLLDLGDKLLRSCFSLESNPSTNFGTSCHESLPGRALLTFKTPNRRPVEAALVSCFIIGLVLLSAGSGPRPQSEGRAVYIQMPSAQVNKCRRDSGNFCVN